MTQEKKEVADIQVRISKETLEKLEEKGCYSDKNPSGIISRIVDEHSEMQKSCAAAAPAKEELVEEPEEIDEEIEKTD